MKRPKASRSVLAAFLGLVALCRPGVAAPSIQVEPGFRRLSRLGEPMPVAVTLSGDNTDRQLEIQIAGTPSGRLLLELPRRTTKRVLLYTEPASLSGDYPELLVRDGDTVLHQEVLQTTALDSRRLVPVVGGASFSTPSAEGPTMDPQSLPDRPRGYRALDALMIFPGAWSLIPEKAMKAISIWVEGGGLLLVPLLSRGERLRLDSSHPFGPLAAGAEEDVRGLCKGLEVELHNELGLRSPEKVPVEEWDRGSLSELPLEAYWSLSINVQRVSKVPGEEPKLRSATVLSLQRRGAGTLGLLAFDPSGENLHQWKHKGRFLDVVLSPAPSGVLARQRPIWPEAAARDIVQPQAGKQPAVGWFVLFILIFILLIGPADYWLVNRLHKPRLTWLTFPVTVLLFSGIAWNMGQGRIGALEYREVTFVDFLRPRAREALAVSFIGVYADTNQSLTFKPLAPRAEVDLLARESGGERAYVEGGKEEDLVQKMHIWAYHGYKTIWREEERILAGVWSGEDGPARILLEQDLPVAPLLSLASWSGKLYRLSAPAGNPAKEPYEARVEKEIPWAELRGALESIWDGRIPAPFIQRLKEETALSPSLIVILPRPWPALEIVERRPSSTLGFCVVRSPLVIQGSEGDK